MNILPTFQRYTAWVATGILACGLACTDADLQPPDKRTSGFPNVTNPSGGNAAEATAGGVSEAGSETQMDATGDVTGETGTTESTTMATGEASGEGSTGGDLDCSMKPEDDRCVACLKSDCCSAFLGCFSDRNCAGFVACLSAGGDLGSCLAKFPDVNITGPEVGNLSQCQMTTCAVACSDDPGSETGSSGASSSDTSETDSTDMTSGEETTADSTDTETTTDAETTGTDGDSTTTSDTGENPFCTAADTDSACNTCMKTNCCSAVTNCYSDADCGGFSTCMATVGDFGTCFGMYPGVDLAGSLLGDLSACQMVTCAASCSG